jgi:uncharacterized membrane protein
MGLAIFTLALLTGVAAVLVIGGQPHAFSSGAMSPVHSRPTSPLDEAERILGSRYAKGEITTDEYARMLAILRR